MEKPPRFVHPSAVSSRLRCLPGILQLIRADIDRSNFKNVSTTAARYQNLSINQTKLSGQCGRLKCCLNYELDTYLDALKDFPEFETKLHTEKGDAICQKQDIFKGLMWFAYTNNFANWHVLKIDQVREIMAENKLKNKDTIVALRYDIK